MGDAVRLARVIGQVVSTVKNTSFDGLTMLVVQDLDDTALADGQLEPAIGRGTVYSVVDPLGAGVEEIVVVAQGSAAVYAMRPRDVPTDATVIGIVDTVAKDGTPIFRKD